MDDSTVELSREDVENTDNEEPGGDDVAQEQEQEHPVNNENDDIELVFIRVFDVHN